MHEAKGVAQGAIDLAQRARALPKGEAPAPAILDLQFALPAFAPRQPRHDLFLQDDDGRGRVVVPVVALTGLGEGVAEELFVSGVDVVQLTIGPADGDGLFRDLHDCLEEAQFGFHQLMGGDLRLQFGGAGLDLPLGRLLRGDIQVDAAHPDGLAVRTALDPTHGKDPVAGTIGPGDGVVHPVVFPTLGGLAPGLSHPLPVLGGEQGQEARVGHVLPYRQAEVAIALLIPVLRARGDIPVPEAQVSVVQGPLQAFRVVPRRPGNLQVGVHAQSTSVTAPAKRPADSFISC